MPKLPKPAAYLFFVQPDTIIAPKGSGRIDVSTEMARRLWNAQRNAGKLKGSARDLLLVVASTDTIPTLGMLCRVGNMAGDTVWVEGKSLVTITGHVHQDGDIYATVTPFAPPAAKPTAKTLGELKQVFVAYAKSDPPGLKIDKLDYALHCFQELKSADEVAWWLIKKLPLSGETRTKLATASTAGQAKFLANWLSSPDRKRETKPANVTSPELFAAVLEAPDDDGPRLAYADWLEERGNPLGEFIRVQCELAKSTGKNLALTRRERALEEEYGRDWKAPLIELGSFSRFDRGFPIPGDVFIQPLVKGKKLFEVSPVSDLTIVHLFDEAKKYQQWKAFLALPGLSRLRRLRFSLVSAMGRGTPQPGWVERFAIGDRGAKMMASCPHLVNLRALGLEHNDITDEGAVALAGSPNLPRLVELDLSMNPIGVDGVEALLTSKRLSLTELVLDGTIIGQPDRRRLQARFEKRIRF